jgi:eukaryotic-like serine/threonine-protein kinase
MQAERWKRVEELFEAARQQPAVGRSEFLRQACPDDPELCKEVESLLKAAETGDQLLDGSAMSSVAERGPALKPGDKLGSFEIVGMLGRGGMGEVYRARDLRLRREVAIKTLPSSFAADRDRLARFEREARAASALNHPNIVSVHDIGNEAGVSFIVSELVEGETLARAVERGPLSLRKLIEVGTQIANGLAAAHEAGVVHRDLKPGNVMLTRDGRVKILDFGLARQDQATGTDSTTVEVSHPGAILGTPGYMSPEQVRGEATDSRSDIFSLGVMLYEMASGKRAFSGGSSVEVINAILREDPPELPAASPAALDRIVRRCIEKEPSRRFQSAADLGFALEAITGPATMQASSRKSRWPFWAGAAMLLCGAGGAAYWFGHRSLPSTALDRSTLRQITSDHGLTADPALSPDGKMLAYASDRGASDNLDIWVQQVGGGDPVHLTSDPADDYDPSFSADGARIAFRSEREGGGIYVTPVLGGDATLLVPKGRQPRFSQDGRYLMYFVGGEAPGRYTVHSALSRHKLMVMSLAEGTQVDVSAGCTQFFSDAAWSPDSKKIIFWADCGGRAAFWLVDPAGKERRLTRWDEYLSRAQIEIGATEIAWLDKPPRLLVFAVAGTATFLVSLPASSDGMGGVGPPRRLTFGTSAETGVSVGGNGRIAIASTLLESHLWGVPLDEAGGSTGPARQLTAESSVEVFPNVSVDGKRLAYVSTEVFGKDLLTGKSRRLSSPGGSGGLPVFNKDGTQVAYCDGISLFTFAFGGGVPQRVSNCDGNLSDWSHDGKVLLVGPAWVGTISALDIATGKETPLLADPGRGVWQGHFSPDSRWVTFNLAEKFNSRIFVALFRHEAIPRTEWRSITDENTWADKPRFSADGRILFFTSNRDGYWCIWGQRLTPEMHPTREPFAVYHSHQMRRSIGNTDIASADISVAKDLIVFPQTEITGNIWLLEPPKADTK